MKKSALALLLILAAAALYVLAWPVPVDPVAWEAPTDRGLTGVFDRDDQLSKARTIDLGTHEGPEDVALGLDGFLYATTQGGDVLKISPNRRTVEVFAQPGGRPLGIEVDYDGSLLIANAYVGIQRISTSGEVTDVLTAVNGKPLVREMMQRAPAFLRPKAVPSSHVIAITGDGDVLMNLQDPDATYPMTTGVLETRTTLFLTTLIGNKLPYLVKEDLL